MSAFIPINGDRRLVSPGREFIHVGGAFLFGGLVVIFLAEIDAVVDVNGSGITESHGILGDVEGMAADVTETTKTIVPPPAPTARAELLIVFVELGAANPEIPVEVGWDRLFLEGVLGVGNVLRCSVGPGVYFTNFTEHVALIPFANESHAFHGVALVAHDGLDTEFV